MARNYDLKIKLSKIEKEKLQRKAEELGLKLSQYIRMVSINANIEFQK